MRLNRIAAAGVATIAAATTVFIAGPALAAQPLTAGTATFGDFQKVADNQTLGQVQQEMGSLGTRRALAHSVPGSNDFAETWQSSSLLGLVTFTVDFAAQGTATPIVDGKGTS